MKHFIKKLFKKKEESNTQVGEYKFIWGVKSYDDLTTSEPNLYTMNDLDICYNEKEGTYILGIETIYMFNNRVSKDQYLAQLLTSFYDYLVNNNLFNASFDPTNLYVYNDGKLFEAKTLTELYYKFKLFVNGFIAI